MTNKMKNNRLKIWREKYLPKILDKLSPRIQRDMSKLIFPKQVDEVESTFIYGRVGSGKTIKAIYLMLNEASNCFINRQPHYVKFISVPELLLEFKNIYNKTGGEITENELVEYYSTYPLLVLDDIGVEKITGWSFQLLYIIINRRYENLMKTIFTSNFSLSELAEKLGDDRIPSRIQQMCKIVKSKDVDYRARG